jgi:Undecaprenyl-phosphate galactose phosphotransferase WbaP
MNEQVWSAHGVATTPLRTRPMWTVGLIVLADVLSLSLSIGGAILITWLLDRPFPKAFYWQAWPAIFLFLLGFAWFRLYPAIAVSAADELRRLCLSTTATFLVIWSAVFFVTKGQGTARAILLIAWFQAMLTLPLGRTLMRGFFSHQAWWGFPVLVMGTRRTAMRVVNALQHQTELGLRPVAVLLDRPKAITQIEGVPVVGELKLAPKLARRWGLSHAILALPKDPAPEMSDLVQRLTGTFPNLLVIPQRVGFGNLRAVVRDMAGVSGLEIRQRLLMTGPRLFKRAIDLSLIVVSSPLVLPFIGLIGLLIKLDSRGPVFYGHERIGHHGQRFKAWKFRSMRQDADAVLEAYLCQHEELRHQWETKHKLTPDPRVTRVGKLLRKFSLDELPQLWNVITGQMTLVGPRPIVTSEVDRYRKIFGLYVKVKPGITGLWQVSGRNDTTYRERVCLDAFYVRNWSVWLDLYILLRTIGVVLRGRGAY